MPEHRETQVAWGNLFLITITGSALAVVSARLGVGAWLLAGLTVVAIVAAQTAWLTVVVDAESVRVRTGAPWIRAMWALSDIVAADETYCPAYGRLIGVVREDGRWVLLRMWRRTFMLGGRGVRLRLRDGSVARVGSDDPQALIGAIQSRGLDATSRPPYRLPSPSSPRGW